MLPFHEDPGLTMAGFLLVVALGAIYWKSAPLESARPAPDMTSNYETRPTDGVAARLWQDPFKTVLTQCPGLKEQAMKGSPQKPVPAGSCGIGSMDVSGETVLKTLWAQSAGKRILLLPTLVWPGAHVEVEEQRRRIRYAVISALIESCYAPRDPERLGVLMSMNGLGEPLLVPYEWYDREPTSCPAGDRGPFDSEASSPSTAKPPPDSVLVLWLDDAQVGKHPFRTLNALLQKVLDAQFTPPEQRSLAIIGPARSDTLRNMVRERACPSLEDLTWEFSVGGAPIRILSPHATVSDAEIIRNTGAVLSNQSLEHVFGAPMAQDLPPIQFLRTSRDDEALITALVAELERRGITVPDKEGADEGDHIVVISEWDTYYGRALPIELAQTLCQKPRCQ